MSDTVMSPTGDRLSRSERQQYADLLQQVKADIKTAESALFRVSHALALIKDGRLYRAHDGTFEEFIESELGKGRQYGYRLIKAHGVLTGLLEDGVSIANLPDTERLCRELGRLDPKMRKNVWERVKLQAERDDKPVDSNSIAEAKGEEATKADGEQTEKQIRRKQAEEIIKTFATISPKIARYGFDFTAWEPMELQQFTLIIDNLANHILRVRQQLKETKVEPEPAVVS
jgi:hypothetical protein